RAVIALLKVKETNQETEGVLYDALYDGRFSKLLLDAIARGRRFKGEGAELHAQQSKVFRKLRGGPEASLEPSLLKGDQSNTSIIYGDQLIVKLNGRITDGLIPNVEFAR